MRRTITALLLPLLLLAAACGDDDSAAADGPDATVAETDDATTTSSEDEAFPRTIVHAMGQTEIRERPERVVVLDTGELAGIAPTVFTEAVGVVWTENLAVHAEALGLEDEAEQMLTAYEARADDIGGRLQQDRGALPTISMVRFLPGATRLYQRASFIGTILEDVGLPRPPSQDVDDFALEISAEQIEQADADIVFTTHYGPVDDTTKTELTTNPLWDQLTAVQRGDLYEVPDDYWMLGIGIGAADLVLDDIEELLLT